MELNSIRILHITNNLGIGGVQKIIYEICNATKEEFGTILVASTGGEYVKRLNKIGVKHITIPDLSSKNPSEIIKIYKTLKKVVKENEINLIHCHHRMAVPFARMIVGKESVIYNNHTIYSDKRLFSHLVLDGVHIIADGEKAKVNVTDFFGVTKNITVINNAVDEFDGVVNSIPEIEKARSEGCFIVMNSARLHPQKGIQYYIDAAEILIKKGLKIRFFIVGDGPLRKEMVQRVNNKKLQNDVIFLGFRNDIKSTISQCDVLVLTSVYEGLPLTPMEAFSVHKAVIGTDIDGTREVIKDGYNGLLAESCNAISIAEKIEYVFTHSEQLQLYNNNAFTSFEDEFSIPNMKKNYFMFYGKFCN